MAFVAPFVFSMLGVGLVAVRDHDRRDRFRDRYLTTRNIEKKPMTAQNPVTAMQHAWIAEQSS